jgi:uncharacterized membrane protein
MVVLSYLGLLALIPYLTKKEDPDILWHAKNGMGLLILDVVVWVVLFVLQMIASRVFSGLGCGIGVIGCVVWLGILALHIYCLIQGIGGKRPNIPMVTDFAQKTL